MYDIAYSKKALADLKRMPRNEALKIRLKIAEYAEDPAAHAHHVKKLKGRGGCRLRVGGWRVIFDTEGAVLAVLRVGARGGVYG